MDWKAAVEADAIGEQQLKWTQSGSSSQSRHNQGVAAEADPIGEQQLCTLSAQRAVRRRITHVGERGGSS